MAGPLRPGENFDPYLSAYPLPSSEYYVVALTEQDHAASRAGCVITNSLLVPQAYWVDDAIPASLVELLKRPAEGGPVLTPDKEPKRGLEPVTSPLLAELVEALLLQERRPVVVFDAPSPELIALRLLTALWPAMRRQFSLCTFALSPRTVGGESFDLVFAPEIARSRFSDWHGSRIGPAAGRECGRHRWTHEIQASIFQAAEPTLMTSSKARALGGNRGSEDEAFFRLLMLWGDLQEKASRSPIAVLGLIDIAMSRGILRGRLLEPEICNAMDIAAKEMKPGEAWTFLRTLMEKLSGRPLSRVERRTLRSVVDDLVQQEWAPALAFLVDYVRGSGKGSRRLANEAARRLAAGRAPEMKDSLVLVPADVLIRVLLLDNDLFAFALADESDDDISPLVETIMEGWRGLNREERAATEMRLLGGLWGAHQTGVVTEILTGMKAERLSAAVGMIWNKKGVRDAKLGDIFCDAALAKGVGDEVRTVFADASGDEDTDRCIAKLLKPVGEDMKWVLEKPELRARRTRVLGLFVEKAREVDLNSAFDDGKVAAVTLDMFMEDIDEYKSAAARMVVLPTLAHGERIDRGLKLYAHLGSPEKGIVSQCIAADLLSDLGGKSTEENEAALKTVLPDVNILKVIEDVFGVDRDGAEVSGLLDRIEAFEEKTRSSLERYGVRIVELVAGRSEFDLTASGAVSLARFIDRAKRKGAERYVKMCFMVLPFAMSGRHMPASPVIVNTFPAVHNELEGVREYFGLLQWFTLADWDRARTLRKELVRAYMDSDWPPADIAIAGLKARVLGRILRRVAKEPRGDRFLEQIEEGARGFKKSNRKKVLKEIGDIRKKSRFIFESET